MDNNNTVMKTKNLNGYFNIVGTNIKKYRNQKGLSQRELSDKLILQGVSLLHSDISRIEAHTLFVRDFEQKAICNVLGITLEQLFEDTSKYFD